MKAEVKVSVDKDVLEKAEAYAKLQGKSISDIVSGYLKLFANTNRHSWKT